jgi:uncharacterized protein DUF542
MTIDSHSTLGDLVDANPAAARVLDGLGLDFSCHGDRTLEDATAAASLDLAAVTAKLDDLDVEGDTSWTTLPPPALADHIVDTHHRYLHEELPLLEALAAKALAVHGERHPELAEVQRLVAAVPATGRCTSGSMRSSTTPTSTSTRRTTCCSPPPSASPEADEPNGCVLVEREDRIWSPRSTRTNSGRHRRSTEARPM